MSLVTLLPAGIRAVLVVMAMLASWSCDAIAQAPPDMYRVTQDTRELPLTNVDVLEDPAGTMTLDQALAAAASGGMRRVSGPKTPTVQLHRDVAYWLKVDIASDPAAPRDWMLEVGRALLDHVRLYTLEDGKWATRGEMGAAFPLSARIVDHRHYVFPVSIEPGTTKSFLLRLQYPGPTNINVTLWQPQALTASAHATFGLFCLYFGLAGGMLLYNLLLWVGVKDRGYLFYTGGVAFTAIGFAGHTGLGAQMVWGDWTWFAMRSMHIGYGGAAFFSALLTRHFLQTAQRLPVIDRILQGVAAASAVGIAAAILFPANVSGMILVPVAIVSALSITTVSVIALTRRWPGGIYFFGAWASLYASVAVMLLRFFGFFPDNVFTANGIAIGAALEMILLSFALADRINEERRQKELARQQVSIARQAGKAEIATNVLHNVGNTLNSANVSAELMMARVAGSRVGPGLRRLTELMDAHAADPQAFLRDDARGRMVLPYLRELATCAEEERKELIEDVERLVASVSHIKSVVATQQVLAGPSVLTERVEPLELVDEALRLSLSEKAHEVEIVKQVREHRCLWLDKTRVLQILVNLIQNAWQAMDAAAGARPLLTVQVDTHGDRLRFEITDNGKGITAEHLPRLFSHGFTTRAGGHGFGLHSSAVAAREMGGTLAARSEGPGAGATFTLDLPLVPT